MSSAPPNTVRDFLAATLKQAEAFSSQPMSDQEFAGKLLQLALNALQAPHGAVWLQASLTRPICDDKFETTHYADPQSPALNYNLKLVQDALNDGQSRALVAGEAELGMGKQDLLLLAPLFADDKPCGVIEVIQRPDVPEAARYNYMKFLEQLAGVASRRWSTPVLRPNAARAEAAAAVAQPMVPPPVPARPAPVAPPPPPPPQPIAPPQVGGVASGHVLPMGEAPLIAAATPADTGPELEAWHAALLRLYGALSRRHTERATVDEGRLLLDCDRVLLVRDLSGTVKVTAVSGAEKVQIRSNQMRAAAKLAKQVIKSGQPLNYQGKVEDLPQGLREPLADYLNESKAKLLVATPLFAESQFDRDVEKPADRPQTRTRKRALGCLIVEQIRTARLPEALTTRLDRLTPHVAAAIQNADEHEGIFLGTALRGIGKARAYLRGHRGWWALAITGAVAAVIAALIIVPWDYRVEGKGRLMPAIQSQIFAPTDGEVAELLVDDGERVTAGQLLVRLDNKQMRQELVQVRNELIERQQLMQSLDAEASQTQIKADRAEFLRIQGRYVEARAAVNGLREREQLLASRVTELEVRAPRDGVAAAFQAEQWLRHRPVRRGELLLEVLDEQGPWRLEVEIPENRMGHLMMARRASTDPLFVEFMLVTDPMKTYDGALASVATRADAATEKDSSVVDAIISLKPDAIPTPRVGAEVRAKVFCGKKPVGYVLFGDVIEFVAKYLWI